MTTTEYLDSVLFALPGAAIIFDDSERVVTANEKGYRLFGFGPEDIIGVSRHAMFDAQICLGLISYTDGTLIAQDASQYRISGKAEKGRQFQCHALRNRLHDKASGQNFESWLFFGQSANEILFQRIEQNLQISGWICDTASSQVYWSEGMWSLHGLDKEFKPDLNTAKALFSEKSQNDITEAMGEALETGNSYTIDLEAKHQSDGPFRARGTGEVVFEDGSPKYVIGTVQNTQSEYASRKSAKDENLALEDQLSHDFLTGLLSRRGMHNKHMVHDASRDCAVYVLDIDRFKIVNDSYGHEAGDALICAISDRLKDLVGDQGDAIRLGGEEFALVIPWEGWKDAIAFGEQVCKQIASTSVETEEHEIHRTVSAGVSHLLLGASFSDALKLADRAQREAKETGRNRIVAADDAFVQDLRERGAFISRLDVQSGLENGEFYYAVQPIWDTSSNTIKGFEALIRWQLGTGETLPPKAFLEVFTDTLTDQKYADIDLEMKRDVLRHLAAFPNAYVSFNYTIEELAADNAYSVISQQLSGILDCPQRILVIEISEAAIHDRVDVSHLKETLEGLGKTGFKIALDDFGVESSNINRLQSLPVDIVKLDKSLIDGITKSSFERTTLIGLALTLWRIGVDVIAEGVETLTQARRLNVYKLPVQQGFIHARPMRPELVEENLASIGKDISLKYPAKGKLK